MASPAIDYARANQQRFLTELKDLLRIPSISTLTEHKSDVQKAAEFVAADLRRIGLDHVEVIPTKGHPLVYADWLHAPGKPTVLCYAHYDVQPPDPLDEWVTPPFEPTLRDGNIYARGSADDKGQMYMHVKAVEALLSIYGRRGSARLPLTPRRRTSGLWHRLALHLGSGDHAAQIVPRTGAAVGGDGIEIALETEARAADRRGRMLGQPAHGIFRSDQPP